ncbi:PIG-L deacetylase family protein [Algoriphagus zhangzhouensis]|nr:PIG-L family deacetylase [Algoriphagus zhangzhouensis]
MKIFLWVMGVLLLLVLLSPFFLIQIGKGALHNPEIPSRDLPFSSDSKLKVLAFFPHPDDEVTVSGTLMKLIEEGHEVHLLCLTRGEAGNSGEGYSKDELAEIRTLEMTQAADRIGATKLHLLEYADSGLNELGLDSLKSIALDRIYAIQPDILFSYDSKVGLYGHPDHRLSGLAVEQVFQENKGNSLFKPQQLFQVTLSPNQIEIALELSEGFKNNYPKEEGEGLPLPDFSIKTQAYFSRVLDVMQAHESQQAVLKDLMPYHDQVPAWIYSRIFDREYFHEVK